MGREYTVKNADYLQNWEDFCFWTILASYLSGFTGIRVHLSVDKVELGLDLDIKHYINALLSSFESKS